MEDKPSSVVSAFNLSKKERKNQENLIFSMLQDQAVDGQSQGLLCNM